MKRRVVGQAVIVSIMLSLAMLTAACGIFDVLNPYIIGPQANSGVIRNSSVGFGLLVFPCGTQPVDKVELGVRTLRSRHFEPILVETFEKPVDPHRLLVSTVADEATPGAIRTILDRSLLDRVNRDETYLTEPWPPSGKQALQIRAFEAGSDLDISGSATIPLNQRFDLQPGQINVAGTVGSTADFKCFRSGHPKAWSFPESNDLAAVGAPASEASLAIMRLLDGEGNSPGFFVTIGNP